MCFTQTFFKFCNTSNTWVTSKLFQLALALITMAGSSTDEIYSDVGRVNVVKNTVDHTIIRQDGWVTIEITFMIGLPIIQILSQS